MSNMLRTQLLKGSLSYAIKLIQPKRCFSVSKHYFNEEDANIQFLSKRVQDVVADFEKPLIDANTMNEDPQTILIQSVEKFKPRKDVISEKVLTKLRTQLHNAYTVSQLRSILVAHRLKHTNLKKQQLISSIIENHWGIKTTEQMKQEAIQRQLDTVRKIFPASRQELFFIIGDNGNTIKSIERENQVNINIDVVHNQYIVEGLLKDVMKAKEEILTQLDITQDTMNVPQFVSDSEELKAEINHALVDISKVAGTFITLQDDTFTLSSLSSESMENAKWLIQLMLKELDTPEKKDYSQTTVVHDHFSEFNILPFHDSPSMSLYNRKLNWNRLESQHKDTRNEFKLLDGQDVGSMENIKDILFKPFNQTDSSNISLEARFGQLLFQNLNNHKSNIKTSLDILDLYKNRIYFLPTMPPRQLTSPFIPLTLDGGFHQRSVQLEYINKYMLENTKKDIDIKKMNVEFTINEQGDMTLKSITGIQHQSVIDILGVYGNVDIRVLANQTMDFSHNEELKHFLIHSCTLSSYSELNAPKTHSINTESDMVLSDITFLNKKRFLVDSQNLVHVNHIEQQDNKLRRTEFMVNSVEPETLNRTNAVTRWSSFAQFLNNVSKKWDYST